MIEPDFSEILLRNEVIARIRGFVESNRSIRLPEFDRTVAGRVLPFARSAVDFGPNDFAGDVAGYRYQFEGEEDLLHLQVTRADGEELSVSEAQQIAAFLLPDLPPALIWLKPGRYSQHFYFGHDELLRA